MAQQNDAVTLNPTEFLKLPVVALNVLFDKFEPNELFHLGLSSPEALDIMQQISTTHKAELCVVTLDATGHKMQITSSKWSSEINWIVRKRAEKPEDAVCENRNIGGIRFDVQAMFNHFVAYCNNNNNGFVAVTNHGLEVFFVPIKVVVNSNVDDIRRILSAPHFRRINELVIEDVDFPDEKLEDVIESVPYIQKIKIPGSPNVYVPQAFSAQEVIMENGDWLLPGDLMKFSECEVLQLQSHSITTAEIGQFINHWLTRTDKPPQKRFVFNWPEGEEFAAFQNIPSSPWDRKKRSKSCWVDAEDREVYNLSSAQDVERSDGLLASIGLCESLLHRVVVFQVWHDRFPTAAGLRRVQARMDRAYRELPNISREYGIGLPQERELLDRSISTERFHELIASANLARLREDLMDPTLGDWFNRHYAILCVRQDLDDLI